MPDPGGHTLRERTRRAVRAEIAEAAMELFAQRGFDDVTVDQIAETVGMSSRTLFRYFDTKEDMVVGSMVHVGEEVAAALALRPAAEGPREALSAAFDEVLKRQEREQRSALARTRLLAETPALRHAQLRKRTAWIDLLTPGIGQRLAVATSGANEHQFRAKTLASLIFACFDVAVDEWAATRRAPLAQIFQEALASMSLLAGRA